MSWRTGLHLPECRAQLNAYLALVDGVRCTLPWNDQLLRLVRIETCTDASIRDGRANCEYTVLLSHVTLVEELP